MRQKLLITGGAGFIGGNFIHFIINKYPHYDIYNVDSLTYAGDLSKHEWMEAESAAGTRYHFIKADITDRDTIIPLFEKEQFDYVVHFAAESHVDRSISDPEIFVQTNVLGTQVLLAAAVQTGVVKFIQISTDEVYGDLDFTSSLYFTEDSPLLPNSPYSSSKASADMLVRAYHKTYGLPLNIIRCSNNYGPYQFPEKLVPLTILRVLAGQKVPVYGDGLNVRDWLHVFDHCRAIDLVLHNGVNGEVYNVGGNNEWTNLEVVRAILTTLGKSDEWIEFVKDRQGHDRRYALDCTKLRKLGWRPTYDFETGIAKTVSWYVENHTWWESIVVEMGNNS